jgi:hypothetical protein
MTPVGRIRAAAPAGAGPVPRGEAVSSHAAATETGHALIAVAPVDRGEDPHHWPRASFLAHLIATAEQLPQTRERRRADPEHVTALYAAASARYPSAGRRMRRTT